MMKNDLYLSLLVNRLPGHRGWQKIKLLNACKSEKDLESGLQDYLASARSRVSKQNIDMDHLRREVDSEIKLLRRWCIDCKLLGEADYPSMLSQISDPPLILYHRGPLSIASEKCVAIVGTRRPTLSGRREAYKLSLEFALAAYVLVSGMAFGIDRSVHEGAIDAKGLTWAVLAGGLDQPSPRTHKRLAGKILDSGGALLGEIPPGIFPARYAFPRRNRILSGLCRGCIIVEAPAKSGALITADFALEQNRDVFVSRAGLDGAASSGTRNLESQGSPVVRCAADVLADWACFPDIRNVREFSEPQRAADLVQLMKNELRGGMYRHMGGWFEYRGA